VGGRGVFVPCSLQTLPVVDGSIRDVPGHGAAVGDDVEGQGVSVIVTSNDGRTARLPTSPFYVRSNSAVPIPAGVDVPDIPLGCGGGFLNLLPRR